MFPWFRPKIIAPQLVPGNPGQGCSLRLTHADSQKAQKEQIDLLDVLAATLQDEKQPAKRHDKALELKSGLLLQPRFVSFADHGSKGMQTVTTIQTNHLSVITPGVFEYQHSTGDDLRDSVTKGFQAWSQGDLPVLLDALREKAQDCTQMEMKLPAEGEGILHTRRVLFGPPVHIVLQPVRMEESADEHSFCPCCLFTRSLEAFQVLLERRGFFAIRLFAARDLQGQASADCRVNGAEWEVGARALAEYVQTWPDIGYEFRKQYVVIQDAKS